MKDNNIAVLIGVVAVLVIISIGLIQPYFEAKAFNKFREVDEVQATYFDALVSDLRVTSE